MAAEEDATCPLCMEAMDATDRATNLCTSCDYSICIWCFHHIMEDASKENLPGRCPNCRTTYDAGSITMERISPDDLEKSVRKQKRRSKGRATINGHGSAGDLDPQASIQLNNVRVVQQNLVYVVGLALDICHEELLQGGDYLGRFGRPMKVSVSRWTPPGFTPTKGAHSGSAYVTYRRPQEASECIAAIDGVMWHGCVVRACLGTTKYCHSFLKGMACNSKECLYLHSYAEGDAVSNSGGVHHASHSNLQLSPDQLHASTSTAHLASTAALPSSAHSQRSSVLPVGDDSWSHEAISRKDSAQLPAPGWTNGSSSAAVAAMSWAALSVAPPSIPARMQQPPPMDWPSLSAPATGQPVAAPAVDPAAPGSAVPQTMAAQLARSTSIPAVSTLQRTVSGKKPGSGSPSSIRTLGKTLVPPPPQMSSAAANSSSKGESPSSQPLPGKPGRDLGAFTVIHPANKAARAASAAIHERSPTAAQPGAQSTADQAWSSSTADWRQASRAGSPHPGSDAAGILPGVVPHLSGPHQAPASPLPMPAATKQPESGLLVAPLAPAAQQQRARSSGPPPGFEGVARRRPPPGFETAVPSQSWVSTGDPAASSGPPSPPMHMPLSPPRQEGLGSSVAPVAHRPQTEAPSGASAALPAATCRQSRFSFAREQADAKAAADAASARLGSGPGVSEPERMESDATPSSEAACRPLTASVRPPPPGFGNILGRQFNEAAPAVEATPHTLATPQASSTLLSHNHLDSREQSGAVLLRHLRSPPDRPANASLAAAVQAASTALSGVYSDPAVLSASPERRSPLTQSSTGTGGAPIGSPNKVSPAASVGKGAVPRPIPARSSRDGGTTLPSAPIGASPRSSRGGRKKRGGKGRVTTAATHG